MGEYLSKRSTKWLSGDGERFFPTLALICVVLLATWMGSANGGYFTGEWAPAALILAVLVSFVSVVGFFVSARLGWSMLALGLLAAYTAWTFASILWSPNRGDAWLGAGQTLLYLLVFWSAVALVALGASRRWALAASALGPAGIAALTLQNLGPQIEHLFEDNRLVGTVGYYNGEAAFLLVSFWVAIYLGGSRRLNPVLRAAVLAGAVLSANLAVLTQSRGAMVALAVSLPVFFLLSGQRLRGMMALTPVALALVAAFPHLNAVYLEFLNEGNPEAALDLALPAVWLGALGAGIYGLAWGLIDQQWQPPKILARAVGTLALAGVLVILAAGTATLNERTGGLETFAQQKWEDFKAGGTSGQEQSRYLSASGTGRYVLWQVAWQNFAAHPVAGTGTHNYEAKYYQLRERPTGTVRQPHMLQLEILSERGIIGGALFFGFLAVCLSAGFRDRFRSLQTEGKAQVGALAAAVAYWFVHSGAEWFWQMPAVTLPAFVYLALLASTWRRHRISPESFRWPLCAGGLAVAALALTATVPLYAADRYLMQSYTTTDPEAALAFAERAQEFNPFDPRLAQREAELAMESGDWKRAESAYMRAIRLNPEHYEPRMLLAAFYERRGDPELALRYYRQAAALNPLDRELPQRVAYLQGAVKQLDGITGAAENMPGG
ncbi:O-antigen ligase family protein [Rubrobacter taiwanensis]|nr:O-antigen ligase family protein [Rubrobacter taiwanensis]